MSLFSWLDPHAYRPRLARLSLEPLESRHLMAADPLPVLMVLADRQDFYYQEYGDTRASLEAAGVSVRVAAATTNPTFPHPNSGQGASTGMVQPDLTLSAVQPADYSAIVFVGGWGSSMYQYAFPGDYANNAYDGNAATKAIVNNLIGDFLAADKHLAAICHGVTVLAWARVNGASPLAGKHVSVPWIGSPAVFYQNQWYAGSQLMQYPQVVANGAIANTASGQYGDPRTVRDDVVVDGRIITAENFDTARAFGARIATEVIAAAQPTPPAPPPLPPPPPPVNHAPTLALAAVSIPENSPLGTPVAVASGSDSDAGQTLTYAIVGGNTGGAFTINAATGVISVANSAALDFETQPSFTLTVQATDNGLPALSAVSSVNVQLLDVSEPPVALPPISLSGSDLLVNGTPGDDTIYLWTSATSQFFAALNGRQFGPYTLPASGRAIVHAGAGNDRVFATDSRRSVTIYGEDGHDQITGGYAGDLLDGGDGLDRIWGMQGNDLIRGGAGNDNLDGREGNDIVLGEDGDDCVSGFSGRDLLVGGLGNDILYGVAPEDLLVKERTADDNNDAALLALLVDWTAR